MVCNSHCILLNLGLRELVSRSNFLLRIKNTFSIDSSRSSSFIFRQNATTKLGLMSPKAFLQHIEVLSGMTEIVEAIEKQVPVHRTTFVSSFFLSNFGAA